LCDRFLTEGYEVICLDNLLTGREENIAHLKRHPHFTFLRHDVTQPFYPDNEVDVVLHFASPASPRDYQKNPIHTLKVDSLGTLNTLGLAKAMGARYVLASTSEVYGDPEIHPQPETYWGHVNPIGPRSCYDEAKRFAEALVMAYHREHGLDVRIARIFNTYGPRMRTDDGRIIPSFIVQALVGKPLTVYGDGSQTRSFCYVDDLVEGVYRLTRVSDEIFGLPEKRVLNLGNPEEVSVLELAKIVRDITRAKVSIEFCPLPQDDPKRRCPDIKRAQKLLDWEPQISLEEGLRRSIIYFQRQIMHA
jgi:dTDP-glucose 4,6-dehydratase